ncbi:MAG TPA: type II toxin-antitoxin system RelE/ParE family toxin [Pirellulales bacterium]|nr:type II toxin-antitoxin system RelE/ParE family toxin [Pirellulales bacterium]
MAEYHVAVSSRAEQDADDIYVWIARRSPDGARRWYSAFRKMLCSLEKDPVRQARAPEAATLGLDIQQALFKTRYGHTYRALYTLVGGTVHLIAVRGAGEELATLDDVDVS